MRRAFLLSLLITLPASLAGAESIKLGTQPPVAGERGAFDSTMSANAMITPKGGAAIPMTMSEVAKKKMEVIAVKDGVVTKAKITFEKRSTSQKLGGKEQSKPSNIDGKTYTLTAGDPITVEPAGEADEVRKEEKNFGKPDRLRQAIASKEYTKGKVVALRPEDAGDVLGSPDVDIAQFTLEYVGMVGKHAKFAMALRVNGKKGVTATDGMSIEMKGSVLVEVATAQPLEMDLSGTMKQDNAVLKMDGKMSLTVRRSVAK